MTELFHIAIIVLAVIGGLFSLIVLAALVSVFFDKSKVKQCKDNVDFTDAT